MLEERLLLWQQSMRGLAAYLAVQYPFLQRVYLRMGDMLQSKVLSRSDVCLVHSMLSSTCLAVVIQRCHCMILVFCARCKCRVRCSRNAVVGKC